MLFFDDKRWNKTKDIRSRCDHDQSLLKCCGCHFSNWKLANHTLHQTFASACYKEVIFFYQLIQFLFQIRRYFLYMT